MGIFGWSLPPGCGTLPGEEPEPPSCENCPEEQYEKCPGIDKCHEVYLDTKPACCLKHHTIFATGEGCGGCMADDFIIIEDSARGVASINPRVGCATCRYLNVVYSPDAEGCLHPQVKEPGFWDRPKEECWEPRV